jgi:arsenate reductase-like glutaredoxin family protein
MSCGRVEEFLSQNSISYELRDQFVEPLSPDELYALFHDEQGCQIGPLIKVGNYIDPANGYGIVYGCDLLRLEERLHGRPGALEDGIVVWGRPSDPGTQKVMEYCRVHGVPAELIDSDLHPLSREELWDLLYFPGTGILQSPLTVVDGQVVLGYDLEWLKRAMGDEGSHLKDVPPRMVSDLRAGQVTEGAEPARQARAER